MAARLLRHVQHSPTTQAWETVLPAIPANRALVVSLITISGIAGAADTNQYKVHLGLGGQGGVNTHLANFSFSHGETVETGKGSILVAGQVIWVYQIGGSPNTIAVQVYGEEVDN